MNMHRLAALAGLVLALAATPVAAQTLQQMQVERVVLLSRHGVRAPTDTNAELDRQVATPFPAWPVAPGELTPRGAELMKFMGSFYREIYAGRGLLSTDRCPRPGTIMAYADVDQRTRVSAQSLLEGIYAQCKIQAEYQADLSRPDPLFHPVAAGVCPIDEARARSFILERVGGSIQNHIDMYMPQYSRLQSVLCPSTPAPGNAQGGASCGLWMQPTRIALKNGRMSIDGPVRTASSMMEIFLLQAAQGMPTNQVAWGRFRDFDELRDLMYLRKIDSDLTQRTDYIAQRSGSALLQAILDGLQRTDDRRLTILVGQDTNIANIAGLLDIHWVIPGFQADDASPGGALAFELLKNPADGTRSVRLAYYAQTVDQMRAQTQFNYNNLAARSEISLPSCLAGGPADSCPLDKFTSIASALIDRSCVPAK